MEVVGCFILVVILFLVAVMSKISFLKWQKRKKEWKRKPYRDFKAENKARYERWWRLRYEFEELKKSERFKKWKREQWICQKKRCAWCKRLIGLNTPYTHVDHVVPLFYGGTNATNNLVLTCSRCNKTKGFKTRGYNNKENGSGKERKGGNKKPNWIRENRYNKGLDYIRNRK